MEKLSPSTPSEIKDQREQDATTHIDNIAQESKAVQELYDKTAQIWTSFEEDKKIQHLE
jgi:hypothetical protein